jgi:hypothetical protein
VSTELIPFTAQELEAWLEWRRQQMLEREAATLRRLLQLGPFTEKGAERNRQRKVRKLESRQLRARRGWLHFVEEQD